MEKHQPLFRQEAINNRLNRNMGVVCINVPLNYSIVACLSLLIIVIIICFIIYAHTTERIFVRGYLDVENGIVTVHSEYGGVIIHSKVEEGQQVKKGEILFLISNEEHKRNKDLNNNLQQRIKNLKREYQLKQDYYKAVATLYQKHYISTSALKSTETELLELSNKIKVVDLELIHYKQQQYQIIKSPIDGIITNIFYKQGQSLERSKSLLQIVPKNSPLIARLYVPSKDVGFLKKNAEVMIKYDAYPSQRFGIYKALIKEINLTVLTDDKEDKPIKVGQPYYKIKAELAIPYINLYGKRSYLSHGMTLTAVIKGETKKIWQWILDPLYSYYGDIFL